MDNLKLKYINNFESIREEWLRFERNAVFYYFQSFLWLSEWYFHIGKNTNSKPFIIAVYSGNDLLALFPFCIERKYGIYRLLTWMGGKLSDYNAPIFSIQLDNEERKDISEKVLSSLVALDRFDIILLNKVPELLDDGKKNPVIYISIIPPYAYLGDSLSAPYMVLSDWESSYAKVSKKIKKDSERSRRRLSEKGSTEFRIANNPDDIRDITKIMIKQKAERLMEMGAKNMFEDANYQKFYIEAGLKIYGEGYLHLSWLSLNEDVIATHWGILFNNRLYWLMPTFNKSYRNYSPGRILMEEVIRWCCNNNIRYFDFCLGDEPYKSDWTDTKMRLHRYLKPLTFKGLIFDKLYWKVRPLLKRYKVM